MSIQNMLSAASLASLLLLAGCSFFGEKTAPAPVEIVTTVQEAPRPYPTAFARPDVPPAQSAVRLEHALSIADRLLLKN